MTIVNGMTFQCNSNTWKSIFSFVMEAGEWIRNKCWMNTKNYKKKYTFLLRNGNMRTNEWKEREKNELKARWQRKILFEIGFENAWPPYDAKKKPRLNSHSLWTKKNCICFHRSRVLGMRVLLIPLYTNVFVLLQQKKHNSQQQCL